MEYQIEQEIGFQYDIEQEAATPDHPDEDAEIQPINQWESPEYFLG